MNNSNHRYLSGLSKGACLAALLASAGVFAESGMSPADEAAQRQANGPSVIVQAADSGTIPERQRAHRTVSAKSEPSNSKRVYLEDYERVHRPVMRQQRTTTYWVGKNPRSN